MRPLRDDVGRPVAAIDAVAGRGGEAPGRRRGASAGPPRADARRERAREAAAGDAELPPEDDAVEMASAVHVLDSVAEVGPNYTLLRSTWKTPAIPGKYPVCWRVSRFRLRFSPRPAHRLRETRFQNIAPNTTNTCEC